jgi:hypothetical protein
MRIMRVVLLIILVLQMLHLPVPCPDLDGECRGTPISSLTDSNAWHLLIVGVRPNDDIDRGPFRKDDSNNSSPLADSPYGDLAITNSTTQLRSNCNFCNVPFLGWIPEFSSIHDTELNTALRKLQHIPLSHSRLDARKRRASACNWQI